VASLSRARPLPLSLAHTRALSLSRSRTHSDALCHQRRCCWRPPAGPGPAGYPSLEATIPALLALQEGGADIIEVGVPFSDPQADGATIQAANVRAIAQGMSLKKTVETVAAARAAGLKVPVILMGYLNPLLACVTA